MTVTPRGHGPEPVTAASTTGDALPALWVNGRPDPVHDYRDPESPVELNEPQRFVENYRKAGGRIDLHYIDQAARQSAASYDLVAAFVHKEMPVEEAKAA